MVFESVLRLWPAGKCQGSDVKASQGIMGLPTDTPDNRNKTA